MQQTSWRNGSGVKIADLDVTHGFAHRGVPLDSATEGALLTRLRSSIPLSPEDALNELVQVAAERCHADGAGIRLEERAQMAHCNSVGLRWQVASDNI